MLCVCQSGLLLPTPTPPLQVRVAKRHIVVSISLKSYQNKGLHTLLRPREWWEAKFAAHGARPNRAVVWALQQKETRWG